MSAPRHDPTLIGALRAVGVTTSSMLPPRERVAAALDALAAAGPLERPIVWLRDAQGVGIAAASGVSESEAMRGRYEHGEGIVGMVVATGEPEVVRDVEAEPRFLGRAVVRRRMRARRTSFLCVPLMHGERPMGAISADRVGATDAELASSLAALEVCAALLHGTLLQWVREDASEAQSAPSPRRAPSGVVGASKAMQRVYEAVEQVATTDTSVLVLGESGTGKELVAQAIHDASPRSTGPFVRVNCGAIPEGLVESELFGHERGAFTGAVQQRLGRFELADGGTIFLDEVGDLPLAMQVKLLRVLQERTFERVGSSATQSADVRVVAATSRDLEQRVADDSFRLDLYYRLNVFPIRVPPLRERGSDIVALTDHFVALHNKRHLRTVRRVATSALDALLAYHWPGNVRELENCVERAVLVSTDDVIHAHNLPPSLQTGATTGTEAGRDLQVQLDNLERALILDALKAERGNMTRAAKRLNVTERIMGLRVKKHAIEPRRFRRSSGRT